MSDQRMSPWHVETNAMLLRRYGKTMEELGELANVLGRCVIQGVDEIDPASGRTNRARLQDEIADVVAQLRCTVKALELDPIAIEQRAQRKERYMADWEEQV